MKTPVTTLDDIKGKKIRGGGPNGEVLKNLGASVVTIPSAEIYTALATGVVDGVQYGSMGSNYPYGFHDDAARARVAAAGFGLACAGAAGLVWPGTDPLALPRPVPIGTAQRSPRACAGLDA
jgi:hypothetical protein